MKGKAAGAKKAALAVKKAGNPPGKVGGVLKPGNLVPRDFFVAQRDMLNLISEYEGISPVNIERAPTLRVLIVTAIRSHNLAELQKLERTRKNDFMAEVHRTACIDPMLVVCADSRNLKALEMLLKLQVNPNQVTLSGETAVHASAKVDFEAGLILLRSFGADFWLTDGAGNTPFMLAATNRSYTVLERLLDYGANPWRKDGAGRFEIEYIEDEDVRKRIAKKAYWLRKQCFAFTLNRSSFSRLSSNLKELVSAYL